MPYFPLLKHVNALGRPKRDVTFGVARLVGTRLRPPLALPHFPLPTLYEYTGGRVYH